MRINLANLPVGIQRRLCVCFYGFNITIIAGLFYAFFSRLLGRYKGTALALLGIILYTLLVGAGPSVVRAALLLSDSGYAPSNPPEWISALRPQVVLLSVAAGNREDLPSLVTLKVVQGYPLLRTDRKGWIELVTDGEQMWVEVERR